MQPKHVLLLTFSLPFCRVFPLIGLPNPCLSVYLMRSFLLTAQECGQNYAYEVCSQKVCCC